MNATLQALSAMSDDRFLAIYESLLNEGYGPLDGEVAKALKFRPHAIRKLALAQRAKHAKKLIERSNSADLAYELLGGYLMDKCPDLVTDFLDVTKLPLLSFHLGRRVEVTKDPDALVAALAAPEPTASVPSGPAVPLIA